LAKNSPNSNVTVRIPVNAQPKLRKCQIHHVDHFEFSVIAALNQDVMANAQNEEEGQTSWFRTIANALMIYLAINTASSFIGGRFGSQKEVSSSGEAGSGQAQQSTNTASPAAPALWPLGTKMV
jgi:hypothetical protein